MYMQKLKADKATIRRIFLLSMEVEFEWIRQYYIQGIKHHQLHTWWDEPVQKLLQYLIQLERKIYKIYMALQLKAKGFTSDNTTAVSKSTAKILPLIPKITNNDSYEEMVAQLTEVSDYFIDNSQIMLLINRYTLHTLFIENRETQRLA